MDADTVSYVQPSVTKMEGVTDLRQVIALAERRNVGVMPHAPYFGPGLLATHVIAASPPPMLVERLYVDLDASLFGDLVDPVAGCMGVPPGPGPGLDPDPAVIAPFRAN